jgi:hypothetical protein
MADYRENILKYIEDLNKAFTAFRVEWNGLTPEEQEYEIVEMQKILDMTCAITPNFNVDKHLDSVVEKYKNDPLGNRASTR